MLFIVLHALLDVLDECFGREGGTSLGIDVELFDFANALALELREDSFGFGEELRALLVWKGFDLLNLVALNIDFQGRRATETADIGGQRRGVDDSRLAVLRQDSIGGNETAEQDNSCSCENCGMRKM